MTPETHTICTLDFPNTEIQGAEPKFTTGEINILAGIHDDPRQISVPVQPGGLPQNPNYSFTPSVALIAVY